MTRLAWFLLVVPGMAWAQLPPGGPVADPGLPHGAARAYLAPAAEPDTTLVLPPPPGPGSSAAASDAEFFHGTRALKDTPRWTLATADADLRPERLAAGFSCAAGLSLDGSPALRQLIARMEADATVVTNGAKNRFRRVRPQVGNDLPVCVPRREALDRSPSYPSGHTTIGWATALVLAELVPERAAPLLARGRAFGDSRVVCGVHWASDVAAGRLNGSALVAALHGDPAFRGDMETARREIAGLRSRPDGAACRREAEAVAAGPVLPP